MSNFIIPVHGSLEKALRAIQSISVDHRPTYSLVLINQGRKYKEKPNQLTVDDAKGEYVVVSASDSETNDAIDKAPDTIQAIINRGKTPAVFMDFDGVVTDNAAYRTQQEEVLYQAIAPHLSS